MTRKDFETIAHVIRTFSSDAVPADDTQWSAEKGWRGTLDSVRRDMAEQFADHLSRTNPRFDRSRFITAATGGN